MRNNLLFTDYGQPVVTGFQLSLSSNLEACMLADEPLAGFYIEDIHMPDTWSRGVLIIHDNKLLRCRTDSYKDRRLEGVVMGVNPINVAWFFLDSKLVATSTSFTCRYRKTTKVYRTETRREMPQFLQGSDFIEFDMQDVYHVRRLQVEDLNIDKSSCRACVQYFGYSKEDGLWSVELLQCDVTVYDEVSRNIQGEADEVYIKGMQRLLQP